MKYAQLIEKFRAGTVTDADLAGVSSEDWLQVRQEAGNGVLRYALTDDAFAAPDGLKVGDMVRWNSSGGRAEGRIERIERDGTINVPGTDFKVKGTEDDPAALIQLFRDGEATDTRVGHKFSTLTKISKGKASYARGDKDEEEKSRRSYRYVMVSDDLIPPLSDRVMANAWDTKEFVYRGSNVLYDHNIQESRPPIGKVSKMQKGVDLRKGGRTFKAMTGDVEFADRGIYDFAGLVEDLVEAKLLSNGSVGFDVMKMRPPTEDEQETMGMKPFSAVIQKANLIEFSITPLGRDKNARLLSEDGTDMLEAKLAEFAEAGVHSDSVLGEFRETLAVDRGAATRFTVTVPDVPEQSVQALSISNADNPVTFADVKAREQLTALEAKVEELQHELSELKVQNQTDLFEALTELSAEPITEQPATGDGSSDLYSLARDLGFTPDN